ncbi:recombinase family protein [Paenibacillus xylaniclasticus]|uniref:recombinase family protein n=1 Tax=Paenibacillus xylaniclasticus TaxID=588083 RepID=UPI000FDB2A0A|nr:MULTISPECIES: recombinase family protein [Paenibacillus]GFN32386.1 hypothetical protein PCURB6_26460 [Paenibacillus curdlanolyticus]
MIILRDKEKLNRQQLEALIGKIKAIIYPRVSSDGQIDNYSIDTQIERCIFHAKTKLNIEEDELLICIEEGESGDNPNRPMLNYMMFLLEKGIGKSIIILHPNRLSRYLHLQQNIAHRVWEMGCDLHFVEMDFDKDNPEQMFMFNIQGSVAQYNKAKILADTKRGRKKMVNSNKIPGMNRCYGYTYDKDLDTLVVNEEEKAVYLKMVDLLLNQDKTCSDIARILSRKHPAPKKSKWYQTTVSRILNNPLYTGTYFYGKTETIQSHGKKTTIKKPKEEWYKIDIPRYIDEETYNRILIKLKKNSKNSSKMGRPSDDYLLKGIVKCGRCGASVSSGVTSKTKEGLIKYYACTAKSKKAFENGESNKVCRGRNWRVDKIDQKLWDLACDIISNPEELLRKISEDNSSTEKLVEFRNKKVSLEKDLKEKNAAIERYIDLYAEGIIKTKQALEEKLIKVREEVEEIERELVIIGDHLMFESAESDKINAMQKTLEKYQKILKSEELTSTDKRQIMNIIFEKVILHDDTIEPVLKLRWFEEEGENSIGTHKNLIIGQGNGGYAYAIRTHLGRLPSGD